jgi:anti-sigma regulatory factor (Ser/Thr protein kinase)
MAAHLFFRGKRYRKISFIIKRDADFGEILNLLSSIEFEGVELPLKAEQIAFAVLELINNSLRAHREKGVEEPVRLRFAGKDSGVHIQVQDWGGGFDTSRLPYDLNTSPEEIDTNADQFQEYRENHGYLRFGIGLYVAKRTFDRFALYFIDEELNEVQWGEDRCRGTQIELEITGVSRER